jgi:hypothetical protein
MGAAAHLELGRFGDLTIAGSAPHPGGTGWLVSLGNNVGHEVATDIVVTMVCATVTP